MLTSKLSSKSSSPAWEEISDVGPELEADTGPNKIHASSQGKAADQCCLPRWLALALASTKDLLSFPHYGCPSPTDIAGVLNIQVKFASRHPTLRA